MGVFGEQGQGLAARRPNFAERDLPGDRLLRVEDNALILYRELFLVVEIAGCGRA